MNCPKCMAPIKEDSLFCPGCGASLGDKVQNIATENDDMDKTMTIPVIRSTEVRESVKSASPVTHHVRSRPEPKAAPKPPVRKQDNSAQKGRKLLIFSVTFLATVVIGLSIALAVVLTDRRDVPDTNVQMDSEEPTAYTPSVSEPAHEEETEKPEEGESVAAETEERGIRIDTGFGFAFGETIEAMPLSYRTLKSADYNYECDLPEEFKFVFDSDGEIRYAAKDNTAYMDIGAFANESSLTAADVKSKAKRDAGGSVTHETDGDGWFSMTIVRDGVSYYQKCYADDEYIRYVEIVYPTEYGSVYGDCVNDIEASFIVTK